MQKPKTMAPPPPRETSRPSLLESVRVPVPVPAVSEPAPPSLVVVTVDVLMAVSALQLKLKQEGEDGQQVWHYLDVRTEEEMAKGHLHNSLNVPYMFVTPQGTREKNPTFVEQVASLFTTEQHILVGCQSGKRSVLAFVDLLVAGFMNVKNVRGGYIAWVGNGLPVVVPPPTPESTQAKTSAREYTT